MFCHHSAFLQLVFVVCLCVIRFIVLLRSARPLCVYLYARFWLRLANKPAKMIDLEDYERHFTVSSWEDEELRVLAFWQSAVNGKNGRTDFFACLSSVFLFVLFISGEELSILNHFFAELPNNMLHASMPPCLHASICSVFSLLLSFVLPLLSCQVMNYRPGARWEQLDYETFLSRTCRATP